MLTLPEIEARAEIGLHDVRSSLRLYHRDPDVADIMPVVRQALRDCAEAVTEELLLAAVLRRFVADSYNYTATNGAAADAVLILDGSVGLTPEEGAAVWRLLGRSDGA